jgi:uncharacterized membrane protein YhaH (DUF805 family)
MLWGTPVRSVRILAILAVVLILAYYGLRALAGQCAGPECEAYIPFSLLLPLAALAVAAISCWLAIGVARRWRQGGWLAFLAVCLFISLVGPIASAYVFRDNPDIFVPVATALILLGPIVALIYSFAGNPSR